MDCLPAIRYFHYNENNGKRMVTIAYRVYLDDRKKNVEYSASIYRQNIENKDDIYIRSRHVHTATQRLIVRPLSSNIKIPDDYKYYRINQTKTKLTNDIREKIKDTQTYKDMKVIYQNFDTELTIFLRKQVHKYGTGAKQRLKKSEIKQQNMKTVQSPIMKRENEGVLDFSNFTKSLISSIENETIDETLSSHYKHMTSSEIIGNVFSNIHVEC